MKAKVMQSVTRITGAGSSVDFVSHPSEELADSIRDNVMIFLQEGRRNDVFVLTIRMEGDEDGKAV